RQNLYDQILAQSCKFSTFITVTDIIVGSITGSGSFAFELGGVQAMTSDLQLSHNLLDIAPFTESPTDPPPVDSTIAPAATDTFTASAPASTFTDSSSSQSTTFEPMP